MNTNPYYVVSVIEQNNKIYYLYSDSNIYEKNENLELKKVEDENVINKIMDLFKKNIQTDNR